MNRIVINLNLVRTIRTDQDKRSIIFVFTELHYVSFTFLTDEKYEEVYSQIGDSDYIGFDEEDLENWRI